MASGQPQQIRTVALVGCGVIGGSWASLLLARGLKVIITDPAPGAKDAFQKYLRDAWPALQEQGAPQSIPEVNYEFVDDIKPRLAEVDFVQENGPERVEFKQQLMKMLDESTRPDVIIASSSSGLPSSSFIQQCTQDPNRILIGHPFNPPHLIPLVEVVPHPETHPRSIANAMDFYRSLGKRPIHIRREIPGFVSNRLQAAVNNEAYSLLSRGIVSAEDLDAAMTTGPGLRWAAIGPIITNALGGGGGPDGFEQRIERLGPGIREWEEDIFKNRFDWSTENVGKLEKETGPYLKSVDWDGIKKDRDDLLLQVVQFKSREKRVA